MLGYYCVEYYNNKSIHIASIYIGVKVIGLWYLIVYVCIIQLMEHLELELDEMMPNYTKMNICTNVCLVYIAKLYCQVSISR